MSADTGAPRKKPGIGLLGGLGIGVLMTLGLAGLAGQDSGASSSAGSNLDTQMPVESVVQAPAVVPASTTEELQTPTKSVPKTTTTDSSAGLSNNNYYVNSTGNTVHAPARTQNSCASVGASAQCRDGSCSFSQHRSGTCSHHGGVATWL